MEELSFNDWKKECKRLLYELDTQTTDENISYVEMDHYKGYYENGLTPKEANEEAYLNDIDNQ